MSVRLFFIRMLVMKIYLASGNLNKKREMSEIFSEHTIVIPKDEGIDFDPVETGTDFYQNSMIKARSLWDIVHCPVIADDSGICVDALGGIPGVWSARYAGPDFPKGKPDGSKISQEEQNAFLIESLNKKLAEFSDITDPKKFVTSENPDYIPAFINGPRSAHYSCSMVLMLNPSRFFIAQETMEGTIIEDIKDARGTYGFGYDPIFFLPQYGKTDAELLPEQKNAISHRGKACRILQKIMAGL